MVAGLHSSVLSEGISLTSNVSGAASGTISGVNGEIYGVYVALGTGMLTAAVTVTTEYGEVALNGVTVTANKMYRVYKNATTNDGSTAITNSCVPLVSGGGSITVSVASATASKGISVTILYR